MTPRVMIVGDSISQGAEGDRTWRHRLAEHLGERDVVVRFVGPWTGTWILPDPRGGELAEFACVQTRIGRYPRGGGFGDGLHYARWGRTLHEAKDGIAGAVAACRPGHLMVALGFNDLAWGVSGPSGLLADLATFVSRARTARPDLRFLVADVVRRTPLAEHPHLGALIGAYNRALPAALATMSTPSSPVLPVALSARYDPYSDAYDGLHPNPIGEIKIAQTFAEAFLATGDRAAA
ncbi:GDSL-type esterase/lipase family protein [Sphaerisporangium rubeum]|uniref:Lysophospholipase L1-like esterase n=1 Tax=Sphaerisporangium rubeum TaxID=321317 RepID=A0A7X0IEV2_9ACTN|nr:lysophospholipase L1-like esterase [Sphaerisporangium rubeum]